MLIEDIGIVLSVKAHGEKSAIVKVLSRRHGILSSFIKSLSSKENKQLYLPGNIITFSWQARLSDHIGMMKADIARSYYSIFMFDKIKLYALVSILSLVEASFKEKEVIADTYDLLVNFIEDLHNEFELKKYILFEIAILKNAGYGINLTRCVISNSNQELFYVSPKTGNAVSAKVAAGYENKLLPLPQFLLYEAAIARVDITNAFNLSGYFFQRYIFHQSYISFPPARIELERILKTTIAKYELI